MYDDDEPMPVQKWWQPDVTYQMKLMQWQERQDQRRRLREFMDPDMPYAATYGTLVGAQGHVEEQGQMDAALRMDHVELRDDEGAVVIADGVNIRATGAVSERVSGKGLLEGGAEGEGAPARKSKKRSTKKGELVAKGQGTLNASGKAALDVSAHADHVLVKDARGRSAEATGVDLDLHLVKRGHLQGELIRVLETELHTVQATHFDLPPAPTEPAKASSSAAKLLEKPAAAEWGTQPVASAGKAAVTTESAVPHLPGVVEKQGEISSLINPIEGVKISDNLTVQVHAEQVVQQVVRCVAVMLQPFHMGGTRGTLVWRLSDKEYEEMGKATGRSLAVSSRPFTVTLSSTENRNKIRASVFRTICSATSALQSLRMFLSVLDPAGSYDDVIRDRLKALQSSADSKETSALLCDLLADMCKERYAIASMNASMFINIDETNLYVSGQFEKATPPDELQHRRVQMLHSTVAGQGQVWDHVPALEILMEHKNLAADKGKQFSKYLTSLGLILLAGLCAHPPTDMHGNSPRDSKGHTDKRYKDMERKCAEYGVHPFWGRLLPGSSKGEVDDKAEEQFVARMWTAIRNDVTACRMQHSEFYSNDAMGFAENGGSPTDPPVSAAFPDEGVDACTQHERDTFRVADRKGIIKTKVDGAYQVDVVKTILKDFIECRLAVWDSLDQLAATNPKVGRYASVPHWKAGYLFTFSKMLAQNLTGHALKPRENEFEKLRFRMLVDLRAKMERDQPAAPSHGPRFSTAPNVRTGAVTKGAERIGDVVYYAKQSPASSGAGSHLSAKATAKKHARVMDDYITLFHCAEKGVLSTGEPGETLLVPRNEHGVEDQDIKNKMEKRMGELRDNTEGSKEELRRLVFAMEKCNTPAKFTEQKDLQRKFNRLFTKGGTPDWFPMPLTETERSRCVAVANKLLAECGKQNAEIGEDRFISDEDKRSAQAAYNQLRAAVRAQENAHSRDDLHGKPYREAHGDLPEQREVKGPIEVAREQARIIHEIHKKVDDANVDVEEEEPDPSFRAHFVPPAQQFGLTDSNRRELRALLEKVKGEVPKKLYDTMEARKLVWPGTPLPSAEYKYTDEAFMDDFIAGEAGSFREQAQEKVNNWMRGMPIEAQAEAEGEVWHMTHEINTYLLKNYFEQ